MTQVKLAMPTMNDSEEDWLCYISAIKIASQRLGINMGRSRQESLHMAWQVHRLAMSVMSTGVWKQYPPLKKLVWSNLKNTVGFIDEMMNYNDISGSDKAKWKGDYSNYMDARNREEGRYYYAYRCRSKSEENAGDPKRKMETTITTEIVVKRQKVEDSMEEMAVVEDLDLSERDEKGDEAKDGEVTATEERDLGIRGTLEVDLDKEEEAHCDEEDEVDSDKEDEAYCDEEDPQRVGAGDEGGSKSKEERTTGFKETGDEDPPSERPEVEGLSGVDNIGGAFVIKHGYKSEEKLYNHLVRFGKVIDIVNEDGSEIEDPENLPKTVVVEFEKAENKVSMSSDQEQQKWKMHNNHFENVTLKEREEGGVRQPCRWDICGDEDVLEMIGNQAQLTIQMKSSVEENEYYSKVTNVYYQGQKVVTCDKGKLCLEKVTEIKDIRMPGRFEKSKNFHTQKCIDMKVIQTIETE